MTVLGRTNDFSNLHPSPSVSWTYEAHSLHINSHLLGLLVLTRAWRSQTKIRRNFRSRPVLPGFGFVRPFFCPFFAPLCLKMPVFCPVRQVCSDSPEFVCFCSSCECPVRCPLVVTLSFMPSETESTGMPGRDESTHKPSFS